MNRSYPKDDLFMMNETQRNYRNAMDPNNTDYQGNIHNTLNGRVDIKTPNTSKLFSMYDKIPAHQVSTFRNPTEGLWNNTPLSMAFFSRENIQIIQNGIRAGVYERSNRQYVVGEQDNDALKIIMRSVFLQYASNQGTRIPEQVHELNKMVLNYCVEQVFSEAQGYLKYLNDASTLVVPIAHPVMPDNSDRELYFKGWF